MSTAIWSIMDEIRFIQSMATVSQVEGYLRSLKSRAVGFEGDRRLTDDERIRLTDVALERWLEIEKERLKELSSN